MQPDRARARRGRSCRCSPAALLVIILIVGLVIDGGNVFLQQRDSQNCADIGAMAGTKRLADYYVARARPTRRTDNVYTAIATRMGQNNCRPALVRLHLDRALRRSAHGRRLRRPRAVAADGHRAADRLRPGRARRHGSTSIAAPRTYLLGVIGQSAWTVNTSATALPGEPTGAPAGQLLPIGLTELPDPGGCGLRADQRLEWPRQLRLGLVGRQQQRRVAGDLACARRTTPPSPCRTSSRAIRARPTPAPSETASSSGSTTSRRS